MENTQADDKTQFVENVKKWVALDSQIKSVNEKITKPIYVSSKYKS